MSKAQHGPKVNWMGATGSALGSVTSAVLVSSLGASGTVIGAGLGTFIITVGGTIYGYYLHRAKTNIEDSAEKIKRPRRHPDPTSGNTTQETRSISAQQDLHSVPVAASQHQTAKPSFGQVLRNIRWPRVAGLAAGLFVLTMAIILVFELATGRPVSSYTGGTSTDSTGTSITGVTDPARDDVEQLPQQDYDPEIEQPPDAPVVPEDEEPADEEQLPEQQVEPEAPEQAPEPAPLQEEPVAPVE